MMNSEIPRSNADYSFGGDVLFLRESEIKRLLTMDEALEVVEKAYRLYGEGKTAMPPKLYLELPEYQGDFRAMPCWIGGAAGLKWVSVYSKNLKHNLPTVMATIILNSPDSGRPLAIMDGTYITEMRTGAAGGVAVKYLARKNASVVGIVGAGVQAKTQLLAISRVLPVTEVKVFDIRRDASYMYVEEMRAKLNVDFYVVDSIDKAVTADIVVTTTPSRVPIVRAEHVRPGTHINAIGADSPGKQELEAEILLRASKIVVDDLEQAAHSGEINVALSQKVISIDNIYGNIGQVVAGVKMGRENDDEITIFDSTGLAILDVACAKMVYEKVKSEGGSSKQ